MEFLKYAFGYINAFLLKNRPIYAHYGITHRCNLQCRMCRVCDEKFEGFELSYPKVQELISCLRSLGIIYLSVSGGEPLLRRDLPDIIAMCTKKGMLVRLLTNGILAEEKLVSALASAGLRNVSVSLDTLNQDTQDYICNFLGAHKKIINSLALFRELLPSSRRILLINSVVSPLNIKELPEISEYARKNGYFISFIPVEDNGKQEFIFNENHHASIDKSYDQLIKMKRKRGNPIFNSTLFLERSRNFLKSGGRLWNCDAGRLYLSINPAGGISICHKFKAENSCFDNTIPQALKTPQFRNKGAYLRKNCPGCMRPCWAELSLLKDKRALWEMCKVQTHML